MTAAPPTMPDPSPETPRTGAASKRVTCAISGAEVPKKKAVELAALRPSLADRIREDHPHLTDDSHVGLKEVERYRTRYVQEMLQEEHGELTELDRQVAESLADHDTIVENIEDDFAERRTFAERVSDGLAAFGGSWAFLISFFAVLLGWMALNVAIGQRDAFDPYPFILLNLVLSCLAAIQAPIIMMSQKRQETKDRLRALNDYKVNLKAELEIRHVQEKLDYLLTRQWQRMTEIQQMQMELMQKNLLLAQRKTRKVAVRKKKPRAKAAVETSGSGSAADGA